MAIDSQASQKYRLKSRREYWNSHRAIGSNTNTLTSLQATMTSVSSVTRVVDDRKTVLMYVPDHTDYS